MCTYFGGFLKGRSLAVFEQHREYIIWKTERLPWASMCVRVSCNLTPPCRCVPHERTNVCKKRNLVRGGASKIVSYHITDFPRCVPIGVYSLYKKKEIVLPRTRQSTRNVRVEKTKKKHGYPKTRYIMSTRYQCPGVTRRRIARRVCDRRAFPRFFLPSKSENNVTCRASLKREIVRIETALPSLAQENPGEERRYRHS